MNAQTIPVPPVKMQPGYSPKPAKRQIPVRNDSPSPSDPPLSPSKSPGNTLNPQYLPVVDGADDQKTFTGSLKNGIVSFPG